MFLCAVTQCNFDADGNCILDGKIVIWLFACQVPDQHCLANHNVGTLEWKCFNNNKEAYKEMIIGNVLLAIIEKWPVEHHGCPVLIQQDNTTLHFPNDDPEFRVAIGELDLNIKMYFQPSNSLDTNVLDLGFLGPFKASNIKCIPTTFHNWWIM